MKIEDKKRKIIELIDESKDNDRKIAFYSDDKVVEILDRLYRKWEENNRVGIPLDYATPEEIDTLYNLAVKYSSSPRGRAYIEFVRSAYSRKKHVEEEEDYEKGKKKMLRKFFGF